MKFTLNWLKDYLSTDHKVDSIAEGLMNIGLEVDSINDFSHQLKQFSVAEIISAEKHPNADRLRVCEVNTADGIKQIVCGAPNAKGGIKVIYAREGSYISSSNLTLVSTNIRGVDSYGMMLSEKELEISENHDEIIEVDNKYSVGQPASEALGLNDTVVEVTTTPNLSYLLSVRNIARDLSAIGLGKFMSWGRLSKLDLNANQQELNINLKIDDTICDRFDCVKIDNINNQSLSPNWLRTRLSLIGQKSINPSVDITNYLAVDLNQPMHVYDSLKLQNNISVVLGSDSEEIETLDNQMYENLKGIPVVKSCNDVISIAGVMGSSLHSAQPQTSSVILECAHFNKDSIFNSSRSLNLHSHSSYRFEKGVDAYEIDTVVKIASNFIISICGGNIVGYKSFISPKVKANDNQLLEISIPDAESLLGVKLTYKEITEYLVNLGFKLTTKDNINYKVTPPSWRTDIEGSYSLYEVILKYVGLINIPMCSPESNVIIKKSYRNDFDRYLKTKQTLANIGAIEVINMPFISEKMAKIFEAYHSSLTLQNPLNSDISVIRGSLMPSLISNVIHNTSHKEVNLSIFEVSNVFKNLKPEGQELQASLILSGHKNFNNWHKMNKLFNFYDAKEILCNLISQLGYNSKSFNFIPKDLPTYYNPYRSAAIYLGKCLVGYIGEIHPLCLKNLDIKSSLTGFELFLGKIPLLKAKKSTLLKIKQTSKIAPINRDFAFIVNQDVTAKQLIDLVYATNPNLISNIRIFDVFVDKKLGDNQKSIALTLKINPKTETLTDDQIADICHDIIKTIESKLHGKLRDF